MKIDLHCHTIATKRGDGNGRNVDKMKFLQHLAGRVELVAITNHNYFDMLQYEDFANNDDVQVWPGIEIDIFENDKRYHCIIVSNPNKLREFINTVGDLTKEGADSFFCTIDQFVDRFKTLDCIVIAHYFTKENAFDDATLRLLQDSFSDINVFVEPSNLRSATILQAHNHRCLIGSDVENWDNYSVDSLPTLKKRIDSFEKFKLLTEKKSSIYVFDNGSMMLSKHESLVKSYIYSKETFEDTIDTLYNLMQKRLIEFTESVKNAGLEKAREIFDEKESEFIVLNNLSQIIGQLSTVYQTKILELITNQNKSNIYVILGCINTYVSKGYDEIHKYVKGLKNAIIDTKVSESAVAVGQTILRERVPADNMGYYIKNEHAVRIQFVDEK